MVSPRRRKVSPTRSDASASEDQASKHSKQESLKKPQNMIPEHVWIKLIFFSLLMILLPIGTYFGVLKYYSNDATTAALFAVAATNLVMAMYVVVAFLEQPEPK